MDDFNSLTKIDPLQTFPFIIIVVSLSMAIISTFINDNLIDVYHLSIIFFPVVYHLSTIVLICVIDRSSWSPLAMVFFTNKLFLCILLIVSTCLADYFYVIDYLYAYYW